MKGWATKQGIIIKYIEPSNPQQNAYVERFNKTVRYDWLNQELSDSLDQVRQQAEAKLNYYNNERPNMSNGGLTPTQQLNMAAQFELFGVSSFGVFQRYRAVSRQLYVWESSSFKLQ